ncbi:MAG: RNA polymerase sigma factor, partial [Proteobacteria bacterium]|nr:RNA polymerase sigma factor [Pseudomonadota bacterium]
ADDLAQEALVKAYRSLRSYRFRSSFSTWLFRITRNVCIDAARSRAAKEKARQTSLRASRACDELAVQPDAQLAREQDRQRLWKALNRLPGEFRSVILLSDVEGMSHDEIAAIERIAVGTVKSRLSRGRRRLRELLRPPASTRPPAGNLSGPSLVKPEGSP